MSPRYLQSNSSSHTRPFSAFAELLGEWRGRAWPRPPEAVLPTWCGGRERNVWSRAGVGGGGEAVAGVRASGLAPAPLAEELEDGSLDRNGVSRIKPRKQGVSQEL